MQVFISVCGFQEYHKVRGLGYILYTINICLNYEEILRR